MRRTRSLLLAATAGVALFASACGVTADTTAATVGGEAVPIDDVTMLVENPVFNGGEEQSNASAQDGDLARGALMFLIERQVWRNLADQWDLDVDDDLLADTADRLDQEAESQQRPPLEGELRELVVEYAAARQAVSRRLADIDPADDTQLRKLYDASDLRWREVCLTVAEVPAGSIEAADERVRSGATVDELPELVEGVQIVAEPSNGCFVEAELGTELRADLAIAAPGTTRGVIVVGDATGLGGFVYRVDERRRIGFDEARASLAAQVEEFATDGPAQWVSALVLEAEVNPRYGTDVALVGSGFAVTPPPKPQPPRAELLADAAFALEALQAAASDPAAGSDPVATGG